MTTTATLTVKCRYFKRTLATWDTLFGDAAAFAANVGRDRLIGISHSQDRFEGVVAVWYWDEPGNIDG